MKVMKFFYKNGFGKRVLSMTLAFLMLFNMFAGQLPGGLLEVKAENTYDVTVHWKNSNGWTNVNVWAWTDSANYSGGTWPGASAIANTDNTGWYDYSMTGVDSSALKLIFNNGSTQTADIPTDLTKGTELWVSGGQSNPTVSYTAPSGWVTGEKKEVKLHFLNTPGWSASATHMWYTVGGVESGTSWPGSAATYDSGYWNVTAKIPAEVATFNYIFNNNNNGSQTANLNLDVSGIGTNQSGEYWIVPVGMDGESHYVVDTYTSAPSFVAPSAQGAMVTFTFIGKNVPSGSNVSLMGINDDWSKGIAFEESGTDGVYTCTTELTPGETYNYKIKIGNAWVKDQSDSNLSNDSNSSYTVPALVSPIVSEGQATFNYYNASATAVTLAGSMNEWSTTANAMTEENGVFTTTLDLKPGAYQYRFVNGENQVVDPSNSNIAKDGENNDCSVVNVPGLLDATATVLTGTACPLPAQLSYFNEDGTTTSVNVASYALAEDTYASKVTIDGTNITVASDCDATSLIFVATTADGKTATVAVTISSILSPEIVENDVTFRYANTSADKVYLEGDWLTDRIEMTEVEEHVFEITVSDLATGTYAYKYIYTLPNGTEEFTTGDPLNLTDGDATKDSYVYMAGLLDGTATVVKGEATELKVNALNADGTTSVATGVTYSVADEYADFVTFADDKITVSKECTATTLEVTVTLGNDTAIIKVTLEEPYDVILHIYNADAWEKMALYLWDAAENKLLGEWPGRQIFADQTLRDETWYEYVLEDFEPGTVNLIVNNKGNGKQTGNLTLPMTETAKEFWIIASSTGGVYSSKAEAEAVLNERIISPEVNGNEVTFRFYYEGDKTVYLRGSMNDWSDNKTPLTKGANNVHECTVTLEPGKYEYKFWYNDGSEYGAWSQDPNNSNSSGDNSVVIVSGLSGANAEGTKSEEITLPETLVYYDESGNKSNVAVTYSVADAADAEFVTIDGNKLVVSTSYAKETMNLIATANGATANVVVKLYDKVYTYTIYVYSKDANRMSTTDSAIYIWDKAGETTLAAADYEFTGTEELSDGHTWLKAVVKLGCSEKLGFIFKSKGSWTWQTSDMFFSNTAKKDCTLYIVDGDSTIYESLDDIEFAPEVDPVVVNGTEVTFNYYAPNALRLSVAGTFNGWDAAAFALTKGDNGVWTGTTTLPAGNYEYKFIVSGTWEDGANRTFAVAGLCGANAEGTKSEEITLPETLVYYDENGNRSNVEVTYTVADAADAEFVTINGNKLVVSTSYADETIDLIATANGETAIVTVTLYDKVYTYTIYVYSKDANRMSTENSAMYIWDKVGETSLAAADYEFIGTEELSDGNTWLKTVVKLGCSKELGLIFKSKGSWTWQTSDFTFKNTEKKDCTLYIVDGDSIVHETLPEMGETPTLVSPEVNGNTVTLRYKSDSASAVYLAGSMNGWSGTATPMTKGANNVFTYTGTFAPGKYEYKFVVGPDWILDPLNENKSDDGYGGFNSVFVVAGLCDGVATATKGEVAELPTELNYVNAQGTTSKKAVTYTVEQESDLAYVTLEGNKLTVSTSCNKESITLIATAASGEKAKVVVSVYDKQYKYTIYAYSENADRMTTDAAALWIWDKAKETNAPDTEYEFTGTEVLADGKTWLKAEVTVGFAKELGIIFKSKGSWTWQTPDLIFENTEKKDCTLYIVESKGKIYTSLDDIYNEPEETYRYLVVEYTRDDNDYTNTNVYTWANGLPENLQGYPFEKVNGKYIAKVPVVYAETDMNVGFIVRKGNASDWSDVVKDGGDNFATFPANQEVVKVKFHDAKVTSQYPYNMGATINRSANAVSFYYRDDAAFLNDTLAALAGKVQVVVKSSTGNAEIDGTHTMTYDEANGRFTYNVPLTDDTDYSYYYLVDGVKVLDVYNTKKIVIDSEEYSIIRNKTYKLDVTASVKNASMDSNDNNLLYVDWAPKAGASLEGFVVTELYADLSELGLGKVAIDPALKTLTIACDDSVPAGTKTIKVVLVDDCDSTHQATTTVNVTARTKVENTDSKLGDFDWDEAVIYFAVTDRFYDGNTANNTLVDAADTTDGSRYHGGDLAGLTAKIDYLYDLGINTIWLTPIVDNVDINVRDAEDNADGQESYGYHGYWASDFTKLNPHLGTEAELKALINAAHAKGMKIMVDIVINHAGYETEEYFNSIISDGNGGYIDMIRGTSQTVNGDDKLSSLSGLPDFMTENEVVRNQLIEWQTKWMKDYGIDYYRVDTVKHVDNTTWAAFKNALTDINPEFKLIGEYYGASYTSTAGQLDSGKMDSLLDFGFKDYAREFVYGNFSSVEAKLAERNNVIDNTSTLGSFLSSHDEAGFLYNLRNSLGATKAENLMKVAATLQITAKGQPVIYYGEEIGLSGANNYPVQDNRYDFDWSKAEAAAADEDSLFNHYKTMLQIRRDYSEIFAKGDRGIATISDSEGYEVINRSYKGDNLYVAMNIKDAAKQVSFFVTGVPGSIYTDLYSGTEYTVADNGKVTISIPKAADGGTAVLVLTEGENAVVEDTNKVTVKLHYNRPDGNYTDWNVWFWADGMGGNGYEFVNEGGDMVATVTVEGRSTTKVNYIVRKGDWELKDVDADQSIDISDIVSGTVHFYVNAGVPGGTRILGADAIKGSKIVSSMYDRATNTVEVVVSAPSSVDKNKAFTITRTDGKVIEIESVSLSENTYTLVLKDDISSLKDVLKSYTLRYEDFDYGLGMPNLYASEEFESQYTYEGKDLGATWSKDATIFKVWAPTADEVKVALYKSGTAGTNDLIAEHPMTLGEKGVWSVIVDGNLNGTYYTYIVDVNGETEEACDPYARTTGVNGKRAMVIDLDSTDPKGWDKDFGPKTDMTYTDAVIYELHVRDASIHESSGVSAANKGKFLGLTETGTTTANGVPTALDHIKDLGVTHVHLLPVYDYGSVDETKLDTPQFNWGYDPVNYNVPEGSYSTNPYDGATRVKEMKEMVQTLHENNINVVMDVVYNHVYDAESFSFNQIVPKYFSRTYADGSYSSGSGCGNDTASERAMVQKYIIESVMYWAEEYHIDGFRFDLVGLIDTETMNGVIDAVHAKYPDVIFYGEGWTMATETSKDVSMSTQQNARLTPQLAYFSDTIRNLLAGDNSATNPGFVSGLKGQESLLSACVTATTSWCPSPTQTVNYASCHDNYTLKDKLNLTRPDATEEDRIKMNNLAASVYMMSQGIPFIHAGEEFLRTKVHEDGRVEHNSYNSSDFVNAIRWNNLEDETYADVADYYKGLIEFRKNHESLRLTTKADVATNMKYYWVTNEVVLFTLEGKDSVEGEVSDGIVVIFNATTQDKEISLYNYATIEEGDWQVCINAEDAGIEVLETITDGKVVADALSATVLVLGETEDTDSVYIDNYREPVEDDEEDTPVNPPVVVPPVTPDTETPDTEAPTNGSTGSGSTGTTTKPEADSEDKTDKEQTTEETVEVIIPVDGSIAEKTEAIVEAIEEVKEGNNVVVKVIDAESGNAEVTVEVLNALEENKDKEVELVIELANGFTWTINANSVDTSKLEAGLAAINFWVDIVEEVVPSELVEKVSGEGMTAMEISLKHNGPFGLTAALDVPVGTEFAGRNATLYYYNPQTGELEAQSMEEVGENGAVRFLFTHASDYVVVVEEAAEDVVDTELVGTEATEKDTEGADNTTGATEGGSGLPIVLVLLVLVLAIAGVVILKKKKAV